MKNVILVLIVITIIAIPAYSQSDLPNPSGAAINFNIGNIGCGGSFPLQDSRNFEGFLSLLSIGIEDRDTNIGIEFSPFMLSIWGAGDENGYIDGFSSMNLINLSLFWNFISYYFDRGHFYMGPFASVNYMFVGDGFYWDQYIFTIGLHTGFRRNFGDFNYNAFSFEVGYRNINGEGRYYVGGKMDIITLLISSFISSHASGINRGIYNTW
ncbi:MAG: hypothetical protein FWD13_11330 [Treponema sp.]|nr:hypothetical protein [Treponema sp.]